MVFLVMDRQNLRKGNGILPGLHMPIIRNKSQSNGQSQRMMRENPGEMLNFDKNHPWKKLA